VGSTADTSIEASLEEVERLGARRAGYTRCPV